jgi:hypothetical protein
MTSLNLSFSQRLPLLAVISEKIAMRGSLLKMSIWRSIRKQIEFSQEEIKKFNFKEENKQIEGTNEVQLNFTWDRSKNNVREITFTDIEILEIKELIKVIDEQNAANEQILDLAIELGINFENAS